MLFKEVMIMREAFVSERSFLLLSIFCIGKLTYLFTKVSPNTVKKPILGVTSRKNETYGGSSDVNVLQQFLGTPDIATNASFPILSGLSIAITFFSIFVIIKFCLQVLYLVIALICT